MKQRIKNFLGTTSSFLMIALSLCLICDAADAARVAVRSAPATTRRSSATTATVTTTPSAGTTEIETEEEFFEASEPVINKASQFDQFMSDAAVSDSDYMADSLAEQIRKQRALADARDNAEFVQTNQNNSLRGGKNICDAGLRECMQKECGSDFSKCALDGDTLFGDKLNRCRRQTTCSGEEFKLFTTEIKADRDMNAQLSSYTSVIDCGNKYNACIQKECGATFNKCLGKAAADRAVKTCDKIARDCAEADSGLAGRVGTVIGRLRENAEKDVKNDETRMYKLRDLMRNQCTHLGAMFDERSFDCVYTVNFFVGENQTTPAASRKLYAGDTFVCNQEWFGVNTTTFKENAYRETRAQTGASSAMLGSGLGTAVGLITSGAMSRALDTQKAEKAAKEECSKQDGKTWKGGECVDEETNNPTTIDETEEKSQKKKKNANNPEEEVANIQASEQSMRIGSTLQINKKFRKDQSVNDALNSWREKCKLLALEDEKIMSTNVETNGDQMRCKIVECNRGYDLVSNDTVCIEQENPDDIDALDNERTVQRINSSAEAVNMVGQIISLTKQDQSVPEIKNAVATWRQKCEQFSNTAAGIKSAKVEQTFLNGGALRLKCVAKECSIQGMTVQDGQCQYSKAALEDMTATVVAKQAQQNAGRTTLNNSRSAPTISSNDNLTYPDKGKISAQINSGIMNMKVGATVSFDKSYENVVKSDISAWGSACINTKKENRIATTNMNQTISGNNIVLKCVVTGCEGSYVVNSSKTGCAPSRGL